MGEIGEVVAVRTTAGKSYTTKVNVYQPSLGELLTGGYP
jgi:hypothetical protein